MPVNFRITVDRTDSRWKSIIPAHYTRVHDGLTVLDFPISESGPSVVNVEYVEFDHRPLTREVVDEIRQRGLRHLDRAETETFLDANTEETSQKWLTSLCGTAKNRGGPTSLAYIFADKSGRYLGLKSDIVDNAFRGQIFLAARK